MIDLDELERLSNGTRACVWYRKYELIGNNGPMFDEDADYVIATPPSVVLELLRIARQHRAVLDAMRAYLPPNGMTRDAFVSRVIEIMDPGEVDTK